jgi:hypothetical protein
MKKKSENLLIETSSKFYRSTSIGISLSKTLKSMIEENEIQIDDAKDIMEIFDKTCAREVTSTLESIGNDGDDLVLEIEVGEFLIFVLLEAF